MAESAANGKGIDLAAAKAALMSSLTSRRIAELRAIEDRIKQKGVVYIWMMSLKN